MENNESNKPQQTGGLKLMTVFIAVLALHVLVIGGFTVYHLMSGGSTEADLVTDKAHKNVKVVSEGSLPGDGQLPDGSADKNSVTTASTASTDVKGAPTDASATDPAAPTDAGSTTASATPVAPAPATVTPPAPVTTTPAASDVVSTTISGPVITPPSTAPAPAPDASSESASTAAPETETSGGAPYTVKSHDSLARIAHHHHISLAKLKEANGLKSDMLRIGQKLVIPGKTELAATTATTPSMDATADTTPTILSGSTTEPTLKKKAGLTHVRALAVKETAGHHLYTVMKGDTLTKIARKFGTTSHAIMAVNNINDARKMKIGQKLKIPSQESRSVTNTAHTPASQPDRIQPRATPSAQLANFVP